MGMHPIYYLIIWQNLHSKMEFNKPCLLLTILWKTWKLTAGLKPLFIEYQNVPATWKQTYKWTRNLNTDTSKLRGNLGEAGLVPSAHNSKSHCYLNFPSLKLDAQLHWIPKQMNRTLTLLSQHIRTAASAETEQCTQINAKFIIAENLRVIAICN